ncbi:MAG TPA: hypothetical protein VFC01_16810 [Mycobacterium sp.]|nr:hypothetical protein [Mycobacterium sp.]
MQIPVTLSLTAGPAFRNGLEVVVGYLTPVIRWSILYLAES